MLGVAQCESLFSPGRMTLLLHVWWILPELAFAIYRKACIPEQSGLPDDNEMILL